MVAFDTDILTRFLAGNLAILARLTNVPLPERAVPIVVMEEALRGRLNSIHQAAAGWGRMSLERAYELFQETLDFLRPLTLLPYTVGADALVQTWRRQKIRVGTRDLRIAAICMIHMAKLATRNARDFGQVPGLDFEVW